MSTPLVDLKALFDKAYRSAGRASIDSKKPALADDGEVRAWRQKRLLRHKKLALADDGPSGEAMVGWGKKSTLHKIRNPQLNADMGCVLPEGSRALRCPLEELTEPENELNSEPEMLLQPETRPISHEQLVIEVKGIYAGLVSVEAKCIDIDERQSATTQEDQSKDWHLKNDQWKSSNAVHRRLLAASQHPLASPALTGVVRYEGIKGAPKLEMPGPPDESSDKLSWMDCVQRYAMARATEGANDIKRETERVMVRDAFDVDSQEPSRLKPSPTRKYLPMMLQGKAIGAQHDTGAEGSNFMTNKLAEDLKLHVRTKESDRKSFSMGTGKVRRAIGRVKAWCSFAKESGTRMKCWFYVLPKLASPLIMGSQFLRDTKTMSHFTHRLEDQPSCTPFAPMVNLISSTQQAKRRLVAFIDDRQTYINADSGSHLDLMSSVYIKKHGYKLDRRRECRKRIQLADATTAETIGHVKVELMLHDGSTYLKTFDVLPGLTSEVLIGEDTLAELKIFTEHESSFIDELGGERHFELSILSYLGRVNEFLVRKLNRSNRRSQYQYQPSLAKQQDDKIMEDLQEQDLEAEKTQREMKRLEASGAVKRRKTA